MYIHNTTKHTILTLLAGRLRGEYLMSGMIGEITSSRESFNTQESGTAERGIEY